MRFISFFIIFLISKNFSFPLIPIWNLEKSSINLLPSKNTETKSIEIFNKKNYDNKMSVNLYKTFTKTDSNKITEQNYIQVINQTPVETNWEDIESFYFIENKGYYVCPKGSEYLNKYDKNNFTDIKPDNFDDSDPNWELICYHQFNRDYIFQGFFNIEKKINFFGLSYKITSNWLNKGAINDGMYDFLWNTASYIESRKYNMFALVLINTSICLQNILITVENNSSDGNTYEFFLDYKNKNEINEKSSYTRAYFDHDTKYFFWMSANGIDDFRSGYSTEKINIESSSVNVGVNKNFTSPFKFLGIYNIKQLDMIRNTRFIYYQIENNENKNENYYGIIDIILNQIIFNTNVKFTKFKPLKNNSMLGFTDTDVYKICAIKKGEDCIDECPSGTLLVLDSINGNHCDKIKQCNLTLIPEQICIESCDTTFFTLNEEKTQCGLCKYIYPDSKPFKLFGKEGCRAKDEINHTYPLFEQYNILDECAPSCQKCNNLSNCIDCYPEYELSNGTCIKKEENICDQNCKECVKNSPKNCTSCYDNNFLQKDKAICVNRCGKGYYNESKYCLNCHNNCETCLKGPEIENNEENQNCETCKSNWNYIIKGDGLPSNCVKECPEEINKEFCLPIIKEKTNIMIFNFITIVIIISLLISHCIFKKICSRKKNNDEIINDLNIELRDDDKKIN